MAGKPIQQSGYFDGELGFDIVNNVTLPNPYHPLARSGMINTTPVPYPKGQRLGENEDTNIKMETYAQDDNKAEQEETYYNRAVTFMSDQSNSLLDYNGDGVLDSKDISAMANDVMSVPQKAASAIEEKITDLGAESITKTGVVEEASRKTDQALVLLKNQSDAALVKIDEVTANVDQRLGTLGNNLALALGGIAIAYVVFGRGD